MRYALLLFFPAVLFFSCGPHPTPVVNNGNCFCSDTLYGDSLCPDIPHEILPFNKVGYQSNMDPKKQPFFDIFSWQSFVALNWPADANGNPLHVPFRSNTSALRVWENYVLADTVFQQTGVGMPIKLKLRPRTAAAKKQLFQFSKFSSDIRVNNQFFEADGSTLIDKNLNYVLYEERINQDEWKYIDSNNLRTEQGQQTFITTRRINLPAGYYDPQQWGKPNSGKVGMIEIKASWRILDPAKGDDTSRYYHQTALITIDSTFTWSHKSLNFTAIVGLVGLHIIHKTGDFTKMIWSTFEHVDNVPDNPQEAQNQQKDYSFYHPACLNCPVNTYPVAVQGKKGMWNDSAPYADSYALFVKGEGNNGRFGTQVSRMFPIYYTTDSLNKVWQAKLAGSVWANYRLVGTQWFFKGDAPPFDTVPNAPVLLGNTTLETYIQSFASCTQCHGSATIAGTPKDSANVARYGSDFSFLFSKAAAPTADIHQPPSVPAAPAKKPH